MKKIVLLMLALVIATVAMAEGVTPQQALEQARSFMQKREAAGSRMRKAPGAVTQLTLERQVSGLYLFNVAGDGGYVIVSNDDRTTPILGFSDSGHIDPENMPDNMRAWLQGYADQIAWLQEHPAASVANARGQRKEPAAKADIGPLLTTTWNQAAPYNNLCPEYQTGHRSVTGCVATAMAQVMKYHQWPATSTAIPGYTTGSYKIDLTDGLPAVTFDWANMANSYTGTTTDAQKTAVAKLMQYCGQSVKMNYGPSSGASISDVATALKTYFGYETTTQYVSRSFYTYANWVDMIYHELEEHRPVLYGGQSSGGGHAFVCDGYQYNDGDFFHINWGWGGQSDSYNVLSVLLPEHQGIGGSSSADGYHTGQEAIVGIQKPDDGGTVHNVASTVDLTINSITLSETSVAHGATVTVTVNVTNNSNNVYDGELSLVINDRLGNGKMVEIAAKSSADCSFEYKPTAAGTYIFKCAKPTVSGGYSWGNTPSATLKVDDQTPSDLVASDVTLTTATIGWTSDATKWNLRSRPLTITEVDFSDGLPSGWTGQAQGGDYWIITPTITLGGSISFWAGGEGTSGSFAVYYYKSDTGKYSNVSQEFTVTSTRKEYTVDLSNYSGTTKLAIIIDGVSGNTADIDNITIVEPGSWTEYENLTAKSITLEGLTPETHYEVQVQAIINDDPTDWSESLIFSTPNITPTNLAAVPTNESALLSWTNGSNETKWNVRYYQRDATKTTYDFSSGWQGWAIGETDGDGKYFVWSSDIGRSGSACLRSASVDESGVLSPQNRLFSPKFTLGGTVSFWACGLDPTAAAEQFRVYLLDASNVIIAQLTDDIVTTSDWTQYTINLRNYSGTGCVMIVHNTVGGQSSLCIDDIVITQPADDWITVNDVTSNPYMLTGLSAASTYDVEVQAVISNTITSNWSRTLTFTTAATAAFELTDNSKANSGVIAAWNGQQATVTLAGRTLYKDGEWNTICLPFNVTLAGSPLAGATAKTLSSATMSGTTVGLTFGDAVTTLQAGTPYIIKWTKAEGYDEADPNTRDIKNPVFTGVSVVSSSAADRTISEADGHVKFIGYYDAKDITAADDDIYYMTVGNTLKHTGVARTLNACRAYFQFSAAAAAARQFVLDFGDDHGDATRLNDSGKMINDNGAGAWYTIDGVRLNGKPTRKGVYIHNGRKEVLK